MLVAVADTSRKLAGCAISSEHKWSHTIKTHMTAHILLRLFRLVNWYCSVFHFLTPGAQSGHRTIFRGDSGWDKGFWCGRLDEDNAHISVTEKGREIVRTVRSLLSQHSLLKRVKGLPWDGKGLIRRGAPPKLTLEMPTMAETCETLRTGGSSSSGARLYRRLDPSQVL